MDKASLACAYAPKGLLNSTARVCRALATIDCTMNKACYTTTYGSRMRHLAMFDSRLYPIHLRSVTNGADSKAATLSPSRHHSSLSHEHCSTIHRDASTRRTPTRLAVLSEMPTAIHKIHALIVQSEASPSTILLTQFR